MFHTTESPKHAHLFNLAASIWNHAFFFQSMSGSGSKPSEELLQQIELNFGSFERFAHQWVEKSMALWGSGWVWLASRQGHLEILTTSGSETALLFREYDTLLCMDNWEHAYYVDYDTRRAYAMNFISAVDWRFVQNNLEAIQNPSKKWRFTRQFKPWVNLEDALDEAHVQVPYFTGPLPEQDHVKGSDEQTSTLFDRITPALGTHGRPGATAGYPSRPMDSMRLPPSN